MINYRMCQKCGWVHFGRTLKEVEEEVHRFNQYYNNQTPEVQNHFGGPSSIDNYKSCFRCGTDHKNFDSVEEGAAPIGSTIQPILIPEEP